jgi:hypothetical protein
VDLPNVVHPTRYRINGVTIELVAYRKLTEEEARMHAAVALRGKKILKKDRGKLFRVMLTVGLAD